MVGEMGDAHAGIQPDFAVRHLHRTAQTGEQLAHDGEDAFPFPDTAQDHGEFVPAQARHGIGLPQRLTQAPGHLTQQFVAGRVAQGVVHHLEAVQIQIKQGER